MTRVSEDVEEISDVFPHFLTGFAAQAVYVGSSLFIVYSLSSKLFLLILVLIPFALLTNHIFIKKIRSISHVEKENAAAVSSTIQEALSGVEVIKAHASELREAEKLGVKLKSLFKTQIQGEMLLTLCHSLSHGIMFTVGCGIVWLGIREIQGGTMSVGDLSTFAAYSYLLTNQINGLAGRFLHLQPTLVALGRVAELLETIPEDGECKKGLTIPQKVKGMIRFENVTFAYESEKPVLKDITLAVSPGEITLLTGESGAGKTTFIHLLLKFLAPGEGKIFLDNVMLDNIESCRLRRQISMVSQNVFLFNENILNNIRYSRPSANEEEVIQAARDASIDSFINSLPDGYETVVGERGCTLSAGQRQRISLARAFLRDAPILILDEPTSALDSETENLIKRSVQKLAAHKTTFIVSHRESMQDISDRVFVLKDGILREVSN